MPKCLVKIRDRYLEWSTVVDAPVTYGMTREDLERYVREEYGAVGLRELPGRLERVERTGTSSHHYTLSDLLSANRAGPDEAHSSEDDIYRRYCTERSA